MLELEAALLHLVCIFIELLQLKWSSWKREGWRETPPCFCPSPRPSHSLSLFGAPQLLSGHFLLIQSELFFAFLTFPSFLPSVRLCFITPHSSSRHLPM